MFLFKISNWMLIRQQYIILKFSFQKQFISLEFVSRDICNYFSHDWEDIISYAHDFGCKQEAQVLPLTLSIGNWPQGHQEGPVVVLYYRKMYPLFLMFSL